ncbi:MAG: site-specific integrase [Mogibacterium sp.]|nr:site-specific integrase [Mogibacterium sp.]
MAVERRKDSNNRVLKEGEYQRPNGTFEYKWRDKRGKRHSVYAKTLEELREKENDVLRDVLDGIRKEKSNLTINDLYDLWVQIKRGLKDNTFQNYKYMFEQFVRDDFGNSKVRELKRTDVRSFYNYLVEEKHLKPHTVDTIHTVLHQVLELGVEDDYIRYNPSDNALRELKRAHTRGAAKRRALTVQEQEIFEDYLARQGQYNKWQPIFTVMLWTGLRVGEVTGLRWSDVDFENETININHTLVFYSKGEGDGCTFAVNTPKTNAGERIIPMLPIVKEAFKRERELQDAFEIKCEVEVDGYTDFVFVNRFGGVQHHATLNKALKRIIRDCNFDILDKNEGKEDVVLLPNFSNHSLRHTFTTRMCEAGMNIKAMQDILGHTDVSTTVDIYAEATEELRRTEMTNLANHFGKNKLIQEKVS